MATQHRTDKGAAFVGLVVTAAALFAICFTIVRLTNSKFDRHEATRAEAPAK
jgi:hypothetical protein